MSQPSLDACIAVRVESDKSIVPDAKTEQNVEKMTLSETLHDLRIHTLPNIPASIRWGLQGRKIL